MKNYFIPILFCSLYLNGQSEETNNSFGVTIPSGVEIEISGEVEVEFINVEGKGGAQYRDEFIQKVDYRSPFDEIDKTVSFTVSITDSTFTNPIYSLENEPTGATIDSSSGQFVWTPTASHGNIEDVNYDFNIIVNADDQEDKESITIIVKKAYEQPVDETEADTVDATVDDTV